MTQSTKNILLGVTASISAYKVCDLITELRSENFSVTAVMTRDAHHFITPLVLESFTANDVIEDFFSVKGRTKPIVALREIVRSLCGSACDGGACLGRP